MDPDRDSRGRFIKGNSYRFGAEDDIIVSDISIEDEVDLLMRNVILFYQYQ